MNKNFTLCVSINIVLLVRCKSSKFFQKRCNEKSLRTTSPFYHFYPARDEGLSIKMLTKFQVQFHYTRVLSFFWIVTSDIAPGMETFVAYQ